MAPSGSSRLRRLRAWILGTLTVFLVPLAALLLCFSCNPGTDMHDAPYVLASGVAIATVALLSSAAWWRVGSRPLERSDEGSSARRE